MPDKKRKRDSDTPAAQAKRVKVTAPAAPSASPSSLPKSTPSAVAPEATASSSVPASIPAAKPPVARRKIRKLIPDRPFPTVPLSVSATGPRSAHKEGKNFICITRKTPLGLYLRRCKEAVLKDNYKTLHLSAMGAAIPHLSLLAASLPSILPFAADEIRMEVTTGTTTVHDEVIPDDEDENTTMETRGKSTMKVVLKIGDGEPSAPVPPTKSQKKSRGRKPRAKGKEKRAADIVVQEPEQMDTL